MSKVFDFVKPGVITGDDVQKVFAVAKENNFALPAVNCVGTDSINAVLEAAAKVRSPVIVQFSNGGAAFIAGKGLKAEAPQQAAILGAISGAHHVHQMAEYYGVPVILHTDHCAKKLLPWIDGLLGAVITNSIKLTKIFFIMLSFNSYFLFSKSRSRLSSAFSFLRRTIHNNAIII